MTRRTEDWRAIALGVGMCGTALVALLAAAPALAYGISGFARRGLVVDSPGPLQAMVVASAAALIGALALTTAYHSLRHSRSQDVPGSVATSLQIGSGLGLFCLWLCSAWLAQFLLQKGPWKLLSAVFYLLSIGIPVYLLMRLTAGGLASGSRRRIWGLLSTGMTLSVGLAVAAEVGLMVVTIIIAALFLVSHPDQVLLVQRLATELAGASGVEQALQVLTPWLAHPWVFMAAIVIFSGFTPVIEEVAKSAAVWMIFDRLEAPSQGFLAGAISGAGFGLLESLLAAANPDSNWTITLLVRGGSTMMHVLAAAIVGWGIGSFRATWRPGRMILGYVTAFLLHGLWNACVVALTFGAARMALNAGSHDSVGLALVLGGCSGLAALCMVLPGALALINGRLRSSALVRRPPLAVPASSGGPGSVNPIATRER